jgi:hypothetical protein
MRRDNMEGQLWPRPPCSGMLSIASQNDIIYNMLCSAVTNSLWRMMDLGLP